MGALHRELRRLFSDVVRWDCEKTPWIAYTYIRNGVDDHMSSTEPLVRCMMNFNEKHAAKIAQQLSCHMQSTATH